MRLVSNSPRLRISCSATSFSGAYSSSRWHFFSCSPSGWASVGVLLSTGETAPSYLPSLRGLRRFFDAPRSLWGIKHLMMSSTFLFFGKCVGLIILEVRITLLKSFTTQSSTAILALIFPATIRCCSLIINPLHRLCSRKTQPRNIRRLLFLSLRLISPVSFKRITLLFLFFLLFIRFWLYPRYLLLSLNGPSFLTLPSIILTLPSIFLPLVLPISLLLVQFSYRPLQFSNLTLKVKYLWV